uniref:Uncharacterized protein n=1 Tax=Eutreptiella gymnastica TaxID=73025 RepID=A0A7S4FMZ4_9EUGL
MTPRHQKVPQHARTECGAATRVSATANKGSRLDSRLGKDAYSCSRFHPIKHIACGICSALEGFHKNRSTASCSMLGKVRSADLCSSHITTALTILDRLRLQEAHIQRPGTAQPA